MGRDVHNKENFLRTSDMQQLLGDRDRSGLAIESGASKGQRTLGKRDFIWSLKAKLNAWVGKYRITFVTFPRQKAASPCSWYTREKQLPIPVYRGTSPDLILGFAS